MDNKRDIIIEGLDQIMNDENMKDSFINDTEREMFRERQEKCTICETVVKETLSDPDLVDNLFCEMCDSLLCPKHAIEKHCFHCESVFCNQCKYNENENQNETCQQCKEFLDFLKVCNNCWEGVCANKVCIHCYHQDKKNYDDCDCSSDTRSFIEWPVDSEFRCSKCCHSFQDELQQQK